jgi:hypothetical protein
MLYRLRNREERIGTGRLGVDAGVVKLGAAKVAEGLAIQLAAAQDQDAVDACRTRCCEPVIE